MHETVQKLVMVLVISVSMIEAGREDKALVTILCIYYLIRFKKNLHNTKAFFDSGSKINIMSPTYVLKLGFYICRTNVGVQKIVESTFVIFEIVVASFQSQD